MKNSNFNTFNNSPSKKGGSKHSFKEMSPGKNMRNTYEAQRQTYPDNLLSQHNNTFPSLKKQIQEALQFQSNTNKYNVMADLLKGTSATNIPPVNSNTHISSPTKTHHFKSRVNTNINMKNYNKYPTQFSLMKSDVSLPSTVFQQDIDMPLGLLSLQVNVTDDILTLREEKLTIMQQYNKAVEMRYKVERELNRLKLKTQKSRQSGTQGNLNEQFVSSSESFTHRRDIDPIIKKNQSLKREYQSLYGVGASPQKQELMDCQEDQKIIIEIQNIQKECQQVQRQIQRLGDPNDKSNDQRFQTFFPNQNNQGNLSENQQLQRLQNYRNQLYQQLARKSPQSELTSYLYQLIDENRQLQMKADQLKAGKGTGGSAKLRQLQQIQNRQKEAKARFYEDLKKFKAEMKEMKQQNQKLRYRN